MSKRRLIVPLLLFSLVGFSVLLAAGEALTKPSNSAVRPAQAPAHDVQMRATDGSAIAGTFWPGPRENAPALLLLHGNDSSRAAMEPNAVWFAEQGYAVLTIDLRGHGESAEADHSFGVRESRDAWAAFRWLKQRQGGAPVGIIGVSLGGAAALLGDEGPIPAQAVVLQAVYPDLRRAIRNRLSVRLGGAAAWVIEPGLSYQSYLRLHVSPSRLSPSAAISKATSTIAVVAGTADTSTTAADTERLLAAAPPGTRVWWVQDLDHPAICDLQSEAYRRFVLGFFEDALGAA